MASQWYCRLMGTELGPFTSKELLEMARQHQITPEDAVRKGPDGMWVEAHRVKGLFEDGSMSTIIMARLPPDVQQAVDGKHDPAPPSTNGTPTDSSGNFAAAKAKPTSVSWHYLSEEGKVGPLRFDQLVEHSRQGRLKPKTRVWSSVSPKWCEAREVDGLGLSGAGDG